MIYQPKNLDALKADFIAHFKAAEQLKITAEMKAEKDPDDSASEPSDFKFSI
ncbi:hypothetical protein ACMV8I_02005 [Ewingella sp. S1.OA.A_B6]